MPIGRTVGGFRLCTGDVFTRVILIRRMKSLCFTLQEMTELLRIIESPGGARSCDLAARGTSTGPSP